MVNSELTAFVTLASTSGVLNLFLCLYVFLKRQHYTKIAHFFIVYTATITIYCFASAFGLMSTTLEQIKFWTIIQYIGMPSSTALGLLFVMQYLGMNVTTKKYIALLTIPFITLGMVMTNDWHHLHYRVFEVEPNLGIPYIHQEIGIWYVIHGIYIFSCMFVAFFLVLSRWKETSKSYRPQMLAIAFGQFVPIVTAFLYLVGFTPPGVDPVPMVLWLSSLLYLWSINSSRLFTLMPIAKDTIFNNINDGVIVLDESYRFIEFNEASKKMFLNLNKSLLGKDFTEVWLELAGGPLPFSLEKTSTYEVKLGGKTYKVRISSLQHGQGSKGILIIFTDITEVKRLQLKLEHQAYYDELTQIYNRRAFFHMCEQIVNEAKGHPIPFTVILMDVDHFKKVNDTYGHDVGDQLLLHVAQICQAEMEEGMVLARYGGEEFVIGLKGKTIEEGEVLANRLRNQVEENPIIMLDTVVSVTLSSGVAGIKDERKETLQEILLRADKALYHAKREGRNQVHVYI
ncbi:histidine kinase N-terminal 7TM domain-containing protein [Robertmurraya massiliosenegalensis]|uniref:histidine kinase N-terminal 7TM domain-containing diguanylate cyclase n=1 Tax=Robertmurraya TaxID=2837507 RepID=UPI0039A548E3